MKKIFFETTDKKLQEEIDIKNNFDIVRREINEGRKRAILYFVSSLVSEAYINTMMESFKWASGTKDSFYTMFNGSVSTETDLKLIKNALYNGVSVILYFNQDYAFLVDTRFYPTRAVSEPESEKAVRGSRDGFNESIITNIGLIRRRIKATTFKVEKYEIGRTTKTLVALCYVEDAIDKEVLQKLKDKLDHVDVNSLVMTDRALEENMFKQIKSPYPLVRYTERPDVAAIQIINGKALILVDTSSTAIITPITLVDHSKHVEEYRQTPLVGSFTRFLRSVAIIVSLFLIPLWLCLVTNSEFSNGVNFAVSNESETPILLQVLAATLLIEIFRIAIIHTPSSLVSALSLVAAIILGQVSMDLGLFLPEILLFVAISAICGFATPSYELSLTNKVVSIALVIISSIFGTIGFIIATTILFLYLVQIKVFNLPYLYPLCPFDYRSFKNVFVRESAHKKQNL